ncbi:MAG: glutamine amidotransferase [Actinobacteria bacterium]|nr:glutamine amidotransferase [Actinomycetota bacterium]
MKKIRVLLAGESWVTNSTHFKGWDFFSSTVYETGVEYLKKALVDAGFDFIHMPSHIAAQEFPSTKEELSNYDVVFLSDIGANTLLLHPDTWNHGKSTPNRLQLLKEWVGEEGGLAMCGGYYSYAGIYGAAKYYRSPIEEALPVNIHTFDDRVETPEGAVPEAVDSNHPILEGLPKTWPLLLGFNEIVLKPEAQLLARVREYTLLAVQAFGKGRTLSWASDIGPHWCPEPFSTWEGYARLWVQSVEWLAGQR